jgi:hypothetical protein
MNTADRQRLAEMERRITQAIATSFEAACGGSLLAHIIAELSDRGIVLEVIEGATKRMQKATAPRG